MQPATGRIDARKRASTESRAPDEPGTSRDHPSDEPLASSQTCRILDSINDLTALLDDTPPRRQCRIVARSPVMYELLDQARCFARSSATVLLTGESGTGKELVARLIHASSGRAAKPYVRVNCAALSEHLIESELFGHERGAFTGAVESRAGRFEAANGGTLLLDEISEMPISLQAKLLRVLEEEEYQRVGGNKTLALDVRVIATTNRNLEKAMQAKTFRPDLFYRLNVLQLRMPPLRDRREDIPLLVEYFLACFRHEATRVPLGFTDAALKRLASHDWPGNVRQLRNLIRRLNVLNTGQYIDVADLTSLSPRHTEVADRFSEMSLEQIERQVILASLQKFNGNKTAAARHLGVTARTLANKMKKYRAQEAA